MIESIKSNTVLIYINPDDYLFHSYMNLVVENFHKK